MQLPSYFLDPPSEFSLMPFWFWNDELEETELLRQIADFADHGVHGFVIHPRIGLPRSIGWMSDRLLHFMRIAIEEARRRGMHVILYDEGMYPSGSSCGQVVAENPSLACRCLATIAAGSPLPSDAEFVATIQSPAGESLTVIDKPAGSFSRGLHYIDESTCEEDEPPAGDILNPATAAAVIRLVYDRFARAFGHHFGKTILGIFTDEPNPLGRCRDPLVRAGNREIVTRSSDELGYDFTPHLASLWFDVPDAEKHRADYARLVHRRLEKNWYAPLSEWCERQNLALCGHPDQPDDIGSLRYFHIPGQDLVWRWVLPDHASALEGPESTQAKCSSSAMIHGNRRRNSNEFCGAYGHETTFEEFQWLANWCFVRGVNLLIPHAFYYSIRGPRKDERPPQVGGVGCSWWDAFKSFADGCRRLCWINTDCTHVCDIASLTTTDHCPWRAAKVCFEHQFDFNYVEVDQLLRSARVTAEGFELAGMFYKVLIVDGMDPLTHELAAALNPMTKAGRVLHFGAPPALNSGGVLEQLRLRCAPVVQPSTDAPGLRVRHVIKNQMHAFLLHNERAAPLAFSLQIRGKLNLWRVDTVTAEALPLDLSETMELSGYQLVLLIGFQ